VVVVSKAKLVVVSESKAKMVVGVVSESRAMLVGGVVVVVVVLVVVVVVVVVLVLVVVVVMVVVVWWWWWRRLWWWWKVIKATQLIPNTPRSNILTLQLIRQSLCTCDKIFSQYIFICIVLLVKLNCMKLSTIYSSYFVNTGKHFGCQS
jgi:hypothetical protein